MKKKKNAVKAEDEAQMLRSAESAFDLAKANRHRSWDSFVVVPSDEEIEWPIGESLADSPFADDDDEPCY